VRDITCTVIGLHVNVEVILEEGRVVVNVINLDVMAGRGKTLEVRLRASRRRQTYG
jgi:hypothetical protein